MHSLQFRPLLLAHIEDLLESEQTNWNSYTIYESMVKTWLRREIRKMNQQELYFVPEENDLWAACRLVAVYLQSLGMRTLPESELAKLITKLPSIEHLQHLDFGGRSLLNRNSNKDYRFAHYSIQEFLVANAVCMDYFESDRKLCAPTLSLPVLTTQIANFMQCIDKTWATKIFSNFNWQELKSDQLTFRDCMKDGGEGPEMIIIPPYHSQFISQIPEERESLQESFPGNQKLTEPFALSRNIIESPEFVGFYYELKRQAENKDFTPIDLKKLLLFRTFELYTNWLADQTGQSYRLPSREELKYATLKSDKTGYIPNINFLINFYDWIDRHESSKAENLPKFLITEVFSPDKTKLLPSYLPPTNHSYNDVSLTKSNRYKDLLFEESLYNDIFVMFLTNRNKLEPIFIVARDL